MSESYVIELEPEVKAWLEVLSPQHYRQAEEKAELLVRSPTTLGEPHSRNLGEGVRELRFILDGNAMRVSYWLASGRRIVFLTVFRKTKIREEAEIKRAKLAKELCEAEHGPAHDEFTREFREEL
ncbi:type II toxin-antitoxin system RelE/ParE family toxin [Streptomyces griseorubiginosus]|uniref:type II toxin-antitoxin system RelE/ParE family toxin n=1 Tax=Streptomyces griseorubiginosus TaxID=67304 RepID=UPI0036A38802